MKDYGHLGSQFRLRSKLYNNHECWWTKDRKYFIAFNKYSAQWMVGEFNRDAFDTITKGFCSPNGQENWPHTVANTWKYFDFKSLHSWIATNNENNIEILEEEISTIESDISSTTGSEVDHIDHVN